MSRYAGTRDGETYTLTADEAACPGAPRALTLACRPGKVSVRPAGAVLIPGKKRNDESMPPARWRPATRRTVTALRCKLGEAWPGGAFNEELVFAARGLEWAHENSDMVVQEGAYRELATSTGR